MSQLLEGKCISAMDHSPHTPDLTPGGFWLFLKFKSVLKRKCFLDAGIKLHLKNFFLTNIPEQHFKSCFEQHLKHWKYCKALEGDSRLLISAALKINF
jgi:hypothetical protein